MKIVLFLNLGLALMPAVVIDQGCLPEAATSTRLLNYATNLAASITPIYEATRITYTLPQVPAEAVSRVTDSSICSAASIALAAHFDLVQPPDVHVIRVGTDPATLRYIVVDPFLGDGTVYGRVEVALIFDSSFNLIVKFS